MLKRSRDDKTYSKNGQSELAPVDASTAAAAANHQQKPNTSPKLVNPNYIRIVTNHLPDIVGATSANVRPNQFQPRFPIKSLNGLRKARPRSAAALAAARNKMPSRCQTPSAIVAATLSANAAATGAANVAATSLLPNNDGGDESDTGCSSLEDDDDFDGKSRMSSDSFLIIHISLSQILAKVISTIHCPNPRTYRPALVLTVI